VVASGTPGALKERLGGRLGLDLYLRGASAAVPSELAALGALREVRPGHLRVVLARSDVARAVELLLAAEAAGLVDDFQLAPPSLEDVYRELEEGERARGAR
jgi:hypothetical protein